MVDILRIVIADGHELMRESLSLLLGREDSVEVVAAVADGPAALAAASENRPDAIIVDIGLPKINGIEVSSKIRGTLPETGIVLISSHDRAEYMKEFLKDDSAGKAYLLKATLNSTRDLIRTIQDVCVGRTVLDPAMVSKLTTSTNVRVGSELKGLTNRELQVIALMAKAHSNRAIAEILYIQPRTVEHHISSILASWDLTLTANIPVGSTQCLRTLMQPASCLSRRMTCTGLPSRRSSQLPRRSLSA